MRAQASARASDSPRRLRGLPSWAASVTSGSLNSGLNCASRRSASANSGSVSSRSALIAQDASRRPRPMRAKGVGLGETHQARDRHARRGARVRARRSKGACRAACRDELLPVLFGKAARHAQAEPHRAAALIERFKRAIPFGSVHIDRPHLDAMLARIAHELRGSIEAHRLRIEDRGAGTHPDDGISSSLRRRRSARS